MGGPRGTAKESPLYLVGVVQESVTDGIRQRRVADVGIPITNGALAGNDGSSQLVVVLNHFKEVAAFLVCQWSQQEIVDN